MGVLCVTNGSSINLDETNLQHNINRIKQASNQDLIPLLKQYIQIQTKKLQNENIKNLFKTQKTLVKELTQKKQIRKQPTSFSDISTYAVEDVANILKSIEKQMQLLKQKYQQNEKYINNQNNTITILKKTVDTRQNLKPMNEMNLTNSSKSRNQLQIENDRNYEVENIEQKTVQGQLNQIINEINRSGAFDEEQEIQRQKIRDIVETKMLKMKQIGKKADMKIDKLQRQIDRTKQELQEKQNKNNNLIKQLEKIKQGGSSLEITLKNQIVKNNNLSKQLKQIQSKYDSCISKNTNISKNQENQQQVKQLSLKSKKQSFVIKLANSNVLLNQQNRISFYYRDKIQQLFKESNKSIINSTKLYEFDHIKTNNLFYYIKNKPNLLLLAKIDNGVVIGGYSSDNWIDPTQTNQAFIFSIPPINIKKNVRRLVPKQGISGKDLVTADMNFLKFGSNQIRIRCQSSEGFTNIAGSTSIFEDPSGQVLNVESFLHKKEYRFSIVDYEVYNLVIGQAERPIKQGNNGKTQIN